MGFPLPLVLHPGRYLASERVRDETWVPLVEI